MIYKQVQTDAEFTAAALLSHAAHRRLVAQMPWLPGRSPQELRARIAACAGHGTVLGRFEGDELIAFLGAFHLTDFRNAGAGCYGPDWCQGVTESADAAAEIRGLYRELAPGLLDAGLRIHAFGAYATEPEIQQTLTELGFGTIVIDAAVPVDELTARPDGMAGATGAGARVAIRRAGEPDAEAIAGLNEHLARHIGDSPIFFPDARGMSAAGWREWLADNDRVALIAEQDGEAVGYIKAEAPADDVSYAVHAPDDLGVNGMYVTEQARRHRVGAALLAELADVAGRMGKRMLSVDFESANSEAIGFWLRWFRPVTHSFERRL